MEKTCKVGLVLEGGSMRGMFTAGVLDTFLDENIEVDGIIGVSAGAVFGPNYYSKQKGRAIRYNKRYCKDKRFMSLESFVLTGNLVNKDFAYYEVTFKHELFDNETYRKNNKGFYVTVSNVETGKAEYLPFEDISQMELLRATAAIPFVSQIVEYNGNKYLDGGVCDSIPVLKAKEMGFDKIVVITTRDLDYRKKEFSKSVRKLAKSVYRKYPKFVDAFIYRPFHYNQTVEQIIEMEKNNEIFVIRPSMPIQLHTIERDENKLQEVYDLGVQVAKERLEALKEYLNG